MAELFMQLEASSLVRVSGRRKRDRKGLEAIFTSQTDTRNIETLIGAGGLVTGLALFTLGAVRTDDPQALGHWGNAVYSTLAFASVGILLMICGGGTIQFAVARGKAVQPGAVSSPRDERSDVDMSEARSDDDTRQMYGPGSRIGAIAFVQSLLLVALYSGLVQESESNSTMRTWVLSNFPVGGSLLSWEGVLILSVSLSLLLLQFLPGRYFSEK